MSEKVLTEKNSITSRILKTELINWRELKFIQNENFKDLSEEAKHKLKASIVSNNFMQPFYVWEDEAGLKWCLDGKHRTLLLEQLIKESVNIPYQLPATFIQCENKKDAAKIVLLFSSQYAKITEQGLFDFLTINDLDFLELKDQIDVPEFSELKFEQKFIHIDIDTEEDEIPITTDENLIVKAGDVFKLNDHVLFCGSFENEARIIEILNGKLARIIFTDPPYNLKTNAFSNNGSVTHEDFAMAAGEMSDEEFAKFLADVMRTSNSFSVLGAIHFICMDWRHAWHMAEASKKIHGFIMPKNLIVWNKNNAGMGSFYRSKHEFVYVFKNGDEKHLSNVNLGDRFRSNVWDYPISTSFNNADKEELKNHPTPKPVQMVVDAILDMTIEGDLVIDWFMGSGTTLIAADLTNRKAFGTEIEPKYIQSNILRYIKHCEKLGKVVKFDHVNGKLTLDSFKTLLS